MTNPRVKNWNKCSYCICDQRSSNVFIKCDQCPYNNRYYISIYVFLYVLFIYAEAGRTSLVQHYFVIDRYGDCDDNWLVPKHEHGQRRVRFWRLRTTYRNFCHVAYDFRCRHCGQYRSHSRGRVFSQTSLYNLFADREPRVCRSSDMSLTSSACGGRPKQGRMAITYLDL